MNQCTYKGMCAGHIVSGVFFTIALVLVALTVSPGQARAAFGVPMTVERGGSALVSWNVSGAPSCQGNFTGSPEYPAYPVYPNNGDGVFSAWNGSARSANGFVTFPSVWGDPSAPFPQYYVFRCTHGGSGQNGGAVLTINDCSSGRVWDNTAKVCIFNSAPTAPNVAAGGLTGMPGVPVGFGLSSTDPDGNQIRYGVDWDNNGSVDEWFPGTGYVNSGTLQTGWHTWATVGTYPVRLLAQDSNGSNSGWSLTSVDIVLAPSSPVVSKGTNAITVSYTKGFSTCVHVMNTSNVLLHTIDWFCGTGPQTITVTPADLTVSVGQQVKICHGNNYNICSPLAPVQGVVEVTPPTGGGTITGPGINCPGDCTESFPAGSTPTIMVNPPLGSSVQGITVNGTNVGSGPSYTLPLVSGPVTITATCAPSASSDLTAVNTAPAAGASFVNPTSITFTGTLTNSTAVTPAGQSVWADVEIDWNQANCAVATAESTQNAGGPWTSLGVGATQLINTTLTRANSELRNGTHCYRMIVDRGGLVTESNNANNAGPWISVTISNLPEGSDGIDNDGDGQTDYPADTDCSSDDDTSESPSVTADLTAVNTAPAAGASFVNPTSITFTGTLTNSTAVTPAGQSVWADVEIDWNQANCAVATAESTQNAGGAWTSLGVGATQPMSATRIKVNSDLRNGSHCYRMIADRGNLVTESNNANNAGPWQAFSISGLPEGSDGIDNDGDGQTDFPADSDCTDDDDTSESPTLLPNLVSTGTFTVPPTGTQNVALNITNVSVQNIGSTPTPVGFSDNFTYQLNGSGPWLPITTVAHGIIANGATETEGPMGVISFTPPSVGTYVIQHCVDAVPALGVIPEGAGEAGNCRLSSVSINVSSAGCGANSNYSGTGCDVPAGSAGQNIPSASCSTGYSGSCNITCSAGVWNVNTDSCTPPNITQFEICDATLTTCTSGASSPTSPGPAHSSVPAGTQLAIRWNSSGADTCTGTGFSTGGTNPASGGPVTVTTSLVPNAQNVYSILCTKGGTAITADSGYVHVMNDNPAPVLTPSLRTVQVGTPITFTWDTNNGNETLCSLTGGGISITNLPGGTPPDPEGGTTANITIQGRTTFTLTCGAQVDVETIDVVPQSFES